MSSIWYYRTFIAVLHIFETPPYLGRKHGLEQRDSLNDTDVCVDWLVPLGGETRFVTER